jgi:hypothetical protein
MSEPFDFEAFIRGTQLPRRTVHVYRVDHRDEIERLEREHDAALPDGDEREASRGSNRRQIAEQIKALRDEMEDSRQAFVLRTLTPDELRQCAEDEAKDVYDQISIQSVEPHLSADQWRQVANAIGAAQWGALVVDANDLVRSRVAVPDFSRSVSQTLSPRESSES